MAGGSFSCIVRKVVEVEVHYSADPSTQEPGLPLIMGGGIKVTLPAGISHKEFEDKTCLFKTPSQPTKAKDAGPPKLKEATNENQVTQDSSKGSTLPSGETKNTKEVGDLPEQKKDSALQEAKDSKEP